MFGDRDGRLNRRAEGAEVMALAIVAVLSLEARAMRMYAAVTGPRAVGEVKPHAFCLQHHRLLWSLRHTQMPLHRALLTVIQALTLRKSPPRVALEPLARIGALRRRLPREVLAALRVEHLDAWRPRGRRGLRSRTLIARAVEIRVVGHRHAACLMGTA